MIGLVYRSNHNRSHFATVYSPERETSNCWLCATVTASLPLTSARVLAQHPFAVLVVPSGVPPFPAPILPLTDVSFPCWLVSWPSLVPPLSESLTGPFLFLVVERVGGR